MVLSGALSVFVLYYINNENYKSNICNITTEHNICVCSTPNSPLSLCTFRLGQQDPRTNDRHAPKTSCDTSSHSPRRHDLPVLMGDVCWSSLFRCFTRFVKRWRKISGVRWCALLARSHFVSINDTLIVGIPSGGR